MAAGGSTPRARRRPRWPLRVYFVGLAALVILVAIAAGAYVYVQSGVDAPHALGIISAGLVVMLLGMFFAYRQVERPIAALSEAVRASRGLDSPSPVPVGGPGEVATLGEDINNLTSSLQRELAERGHAERNYKLLFDNHPEPLWVYDLASLRFVEVNDAAVGRYGYSRDEFLHMTIEDIRPPEEVPALTETLSSIEPSSRTGPWVHRAKDGSTFEVEITSHALIFANRTARFVMAQDVTEKRKLERQFQQAQRLESLGQLAGGVAHDFNNLLAVILNLNSSVMQRLEAADASRDPRSADDLKDLQKVDQAARSASRLTRQLLAFARKEVVQATVISVTDQVAGLMELLHRTLGSHIVLTATLPTGVWPVIMDPGHLEQVVINLAANSRDAMPMGGRLLISVQNLTVDAAYATGKPDIQPGRYVQLQVSDTGTGMDKHALEHAFEPFFTTKALGQGTGLGLATVYGIVKQLQGNVQIDSEPGQGTSVTVIIPATSQQVAPRVATVPPTSRAETKTRTENATILVVEDYPELRELIDEILKSAGFGVYTAADGAAGLSLAREHRGEIDLLLTDVVMPNMLGPDLAEQLKIDNPGLRVLFMSGHAQPMLGAASALWPGMQLLQKPFMAQELLDKIQEVLAGPPGGGTVGISR